MSRRSLRTIDGFGPKPRRRTVLHRSDGGREARLRLVPGLESGPIDAADVLLLEHDLRSLERVATRDRNRESTRGLGRLVRRAGLLRRRRETALWPYRRRLHRVRLV